MYCIITKNINLVMLSATIDKPEEFASWIGNIKQTPINLIPTSHRVVPLKHYFWKSYNLKIIMVKMILDGNLLNYLMIKVNLKIMI